MRMAMRFFTMAACLVFCARPYAESRMVSGGSLTAIFTADGDLTQISFGPGLPPTVVHGGLALADCHVEGAVEIQTRADGGLEITRHWIHGTTGAECAVVEKIYPAFSGIRWESEIRGAGDPWTTAIETRLSWPSTGDTRFWTAWSDPLPEGTGWNDPLVLEPFTSRELFYGAPAFDEKNPLTGYCPLKGDIFCIPIAMMAEPLRDYALSVCLSPDDDVLDLTLATTSEGGVTFSRLNHRIGAASPLHFTVDLVGHAADWRAALNVMSSYYPAYFNAPNPRVHGLAGCGTYSSYEGDLDVGKYRRMAFRINWKASFDFPYMGMFLPPVSDPEAQWPRFVVDRRPEGPREMTSLRQLREYSGRMRGMGFFVLNYFNVTEFGTEIKGPSAQQPNLPEAEVWKSANDFLYGKIADGVLYSESGTTWGTWGGAIAMDPAGPSYQSFLLNQARRHIQEIPDSDGICIDRMDWLRFYNPRRDDGRSWRNGRAYGSLYFSWKEILGQLGPIMHSADKVIFVNNHLKRIDLLKEVDGLYCEFSHHGHALNATGLLTVAKPALGWTASEADLRPSPDALFQRHLHLGVFPTAPLIGNDHTILPTPWVEQQYLDYGPLLDALRGKRWVLQAHVIEVGAGSARVNLFEIPGGYVIPVTFARPEQGRVGVVLRHLPIPSGVLVLRGEVLHPGETLWEPLAEVAVGETITLEAPVQRGCAMVRLLYAGNAK